jgi:hypothetical protein
MGLLYTTDVIVMPHSLFIGYARANCSVSHVISVFSSLLGDIIDHVDETTHKDPKGYIYKMFFIHFKASNSKLQDVYSRIDKEGVICVHNGQIGRHGEKWFWKVDKQVVSQPYIMSSDEIRSIRLKHVIEHEAQFHSLSCHPLPPPPK